MKDFIEILASLFSIAFAAAGIAKAFGRGGIETSLKLLQVRDTLFPEGNTCAAEESTKSLYSNLTQLAEYHADRKVQSLGLLPCSRLLHNLCLLSIGIAAGLLGHDGIYVFIFSGTVESSLVELGLNTILAVALVFGAFYLIFRRNEQLAWQVYKKRGGRNLLARCCGRTANTNNNGFCYFSCYVPLWLFCPGKPYDVGNAGYSCGVSRRLRGGDC